MTTESQVVGDDHTTLTGGAFENIDVRSTDKLFVPRRAQIAAPRAESGDDVRSDVLV